jgi:hypothetical protein
VIKGEHFLAMRSWRVYFLLQPFYFLHRHSLALGRLWTLSLPKALNESKGRNGIAWVYVAQGH